MLSAWSSSRLPTSGLDTTAVASSATAPDRCCCMRHSNQTSKNYTSAKPGARLQQERLHTLNTAGFASAAFATG
jgi:hypothetical protein